MEESANVVVNNAAKVLILIIMEDTHGVAITQPTV